MGQRTAGNEVFEAYLRERDVSIPVHEPDFGIGKRADYLVTLGSVSWPMTTVLKPICSKVHEGSRQLRRAGHPRRTRVHLGA
jgi:hypothetical protein